MDRLFANDDKNEDDEGKFFYIIDTENDHSNLEPEGCEPRYKIGFLKTHKTASRYS